MGKATGFLDYGRIDTPCSPPAERITHFHEFHQPLSEEQRAEQGARCMNCGVPFCQSAFGCPLHNLIPEWNDAIFTGNWSHALSRLLKTSNFPEFTGRVCPAPCESACTCSMDDVASAVTIRENELAIVEYAWAHGFIQPEIPVIRTEKHIAVVGSGPSGLAAADQLNRRGHNITVFERDDRPGGLLMYGIPSMKLEKNVILRRIGKMQSEGITFRIGTEVGKDISGRRLLKEYDAVVLCCGARQPREVAAIDRSVPGVALAVDYLTESTKALLAEKESTMSAKGLSVVVVGNGDTATDCVATAIRQGAKSVVQLVRKPRKPDAGRIWPYRSTAEKTAYGQEEAACVYGQDPRLYSTTVQQLLTDENGRLCALRLQQGEEESEIPAQLLLIAAGFAGVEDRTAKTFSLHKDEKGLLTSDGFSVGEKVFICGDARMGASLVVRAIADGRDCARAVDRFLEGYTHL